MQFEQFRNLLQDHVASMLDGVTTLFVADVDKEALWALYLDSFPPGANLVFRTRREFDCSCCKNFMRAFGNVVLIQGTQVVSIWDFTTHDTTYQPVIDALSAYVKAAPICDVFVTKERGFGTALSYEQIEGGAREWNHFRVDFPPSFVTRSSRSESSVMAEYRDSKHVFQRSLEEISLDAVDTVIDMIAENTLYKGAEWQAALTQFRNLHAIYDALASHEKDLFLWRESVLAGTALSRIKNHSIGTLLVDLTEGTDVEVAVRKYEAIVAPTHYKRTKAIFTKKMVEDAQKTITDLGLLDSLGRRHATLADITINNILFANRSAVARMTGDVFAELHLEAKAGKKPEGVAGMAIADFIATVLPTAKSIEAWVGSDNESDLVSLVAPQVKNSPSLFKWDNGFSWAYNGNIADSMKQRVKAAGGKVDGVLRFSIQWNTQGDNPNDYDAHCVEPNGNHIYYPFKGQQSASSGMLDVDIIQPRREQVAVENITWATRTRMQEGEYRFFVHNYSHRGGHSGFSAEIEFDDKLFQFEHPVDIYHGEEVEVAKVTFSRKSGFTLVESLKSTAATKTLWGIETNRFHPVSVIMASPNHWDGQPGLGHKHTFFMLQGCVNDTQPNGFFNEFLREEFMMHKRVFEALGSKMKVEPTSDQLSGLGFSATKRNSLLVKVQDNTGSSRMVNLVF